MPTPPPTPNADYIGIRKQLYLDIIAQIKTITTGAVAELHSPIFLFKHFDLWNEQVANLATEPAFHRPALFIQFLPIQWENLTRGLRQANAVIRLHIVADTKHRSADGASHQVDALTYLGYPDAVNRAMHTFSQPYAGRPENITSETDHDHTDVIDMIEEFIIRVVDATAVRIPTTASNVQPVINPPYTS